MWPNFKKMHSCWCSILTELVDVWSVCSTCTNQRWLWPQLLIQQFYASGSLEQCSEAVEASLVYVHAELKKLDPSEFSVSLSFPSYRGKPLDRNVRHPRVTCGGGGWSTRVQCWRLSTHKTVLHSRLRFTVRHKDNVWSWTLFCLIHSSLWSVSSHNFYMGMQNVPKLEDS